MTGWTRWTGSQRLGGVGCETGIRLCSDNMYGIEAYKLIKANLNAKILSVSRVGNYATVYKHDTRREKMPMSSALASIKGVGNPWQARGCDAY